MCRVRTKHQTMKVITVDLVIQVFSSSWLTTWVQGEGELRGIEIMQQAGEGHDNDDRMMVQPLQHRPLIVRTVAQRTLRRHRGVEVPLHDVGGRIKVEVVVVTNDRHLMITGRGFVHNKCSRISMVEKKLEGD